jgi:hypothetical protein
MMSKTKAADGTGADDEEAANDVKITVTISPIPSLIPDICAMKIAEADIKSAVPSMFMTPIGNTNLVILLSTLSFCSIVTIVVGRAAALNVRFKEKKKNSFIGVVL